MNSYSASVFAPRMPVDDLLLSNFSREELTWVANSILGANSLKNSKSRETEEAKALLATHRSNPQFLVLVMQTISKTTDGANVPITTFNVVDELKALGAKVHISDPEAQTSAVNVVLGETEIQVNQALGLINPMKLAPLFPGRLVAQWDFQAANLAFFIGCLTEHRISVAHEGFNSRRSAKISVAIGTDFLTGLKIQNLSEPLLILFAKTLGDLIPSFGRLDTYTGVAWAHVAYLALMKLEHGYRLSVVGKLFAMLFENVPARGSFRPPSDSETMLMKAAAAKLGATFDARDFLFQKKAVDVKIPGVKDTPEAAYTYLRMCRNYRGKDEIGMSGMSAGAYGGQFTSRDNAKVQKCASVIAYFNPPPGTTVYVTMTDANVCLALHATFPELGLRFPGHTMKIAGVGFESYVPDMSLAWWFDFSSFSLEDKANRDTMDQFAARLADETSKKITATVNTRPAVYICQAKILTFNINVRNYNVRYYPSVTPHNMVTTLAVIQDAVPHKFPPEIGIRQMCALANASNSYRNFYFLHRVSIAKRVETRAQAHFIPLVGFLRPSKVKFDSYTDFVSLTQAGVDLDPESVEKIAGELALMQETKFSDARHAQIGVIDNLINAQRNRGMGIDGDPAVNDAVRVTGPIIAPISRPVDDDGSARRPDGADADSDNEVDLDAYVDGK